MTRKDTDGASGGDEEPVGECSSRPSMSNTSWPDVRDSSVSNISNKMTTNCQQQCLHDIDIDNNDDNNKQPLCFRKKVNDCIAQIGVTCETGLSTSVQSVADSRRCSTSGTDNKMPAISKAQMKEFEEAFNLFDKDRDGSITKDELGRVMRGLGQFARTEELNTMLEEIDTDGDGNVSLVEFVKIVSNIGNASAAQTTDLSQEEQEEQELRDAFRVFDKHNRGYITASDLRAVLQCLGEDLSEEEIEDMIKEVDEDGDGRIDFYEFARSLVEPGNDDDEEEDEEEPPQSPPF
ncbi:calmodulin-like isoform X2 [Aphidius gifuensis]|uniref:calmodulin-like isoform X2 n=1 Tax=Aphidius gifuensis TaxID=684658 RepID=UPI001CDC1007|nr:calmodulin-like isoform X2 [Aphidius gifuensis]